jgi:uncharacterized protein (DUF3084 family)
MEDGTEKKNFNLKPLVVILLLLLGGCVYYIYQLTTEKEQLDTEIAVVTVDKQKALDSLSILKETYDRAIADKDSLNSELLAEREKVVNLIEELNKSKEDVNTLRVFKSKYKQIQASFNALVSKDSEFKTLNEKLTRERDSTALILQEQKNLIDSQASLNNELKSKVEKASKLIVTNIKTEAIREKSTGEQIVTEKARKANKLKICFTIAANEVADSGDKIYYVQIIDAKSNIMGIKQVKYFGDKSIDYSFETKVKFNNKSVDVCNFLDNNGQEFVKGQYFVNLFDKEALVSKTSFVLK